MVDPEPTREERRGGDTLWKMKASFELHFGHPLLRIGLKDPKDRQNTKLQKCKYIKVLKLHQRYTKQDGNCFSYGIENYIFFAVKEILPVRPKITFFPTLDVKVFRGERSKKLPPFFPLEARKKARKGDKMVKLFHNRISSLLLWTRLPPLNLIKNILFHFSWHTKNGK